MPLTPNYSWQMPDPTDFVTNLPADFETFGDAVDADLAGLLGGTTGQILTKDSNDDHDFSWQTPASAGLIQSVGATTTTLTGISSTSFTDSTITATITPTSASSKILILVSAECLIFSTNGGTNARAEIRIMRDSTPVFTTVPLVANSTLSSGTINNYAMNASAAMVYLDSPNTISPITYKVQGRVSTTTNSTFMRFQPDEDSGIVLLELGA